MAPMTSFHPAFRWARACAWASLAAQMLIVVTGAFVRVTASGLGCPTWPECMPGSYTPVTVPETVYHAWVEFGNRLLTFVVAVTALAALASYLWARNRGALPVGRLPIRGGPWLAASALLGTAAQAVVGGISVLTGLSPAWVAAHFLLSAVILVAQTRYVTGLELLAVDRHNARNASVVVGAPSVTRRLPAAMCLAAAVVVALGTVVTGSGPHAGDINVTERFQIDPKLATWIHAAAAAVLVLLTIVVNIRRATIPRSVHRPALVLLLLQGCQAVLGVAQFTAGLPPLMVVAHVALAVTIWAGCLRLFWRWPTTSW